MCLSMQNKTAVMGRKHVLGASAVQMAGLEARNMTAAMGRQSKLTAVEVLLTLDAGTRMFGKGVSISTGST